VKVLALDKFEGEQILVAEESKQELKYVESQSKKRKKLKYVDEEGKKTNSEAITMTCFEDYQRKV